MKSKEKVIISIALGIILFLGSSVIYKLITYTGLNKIEVGSSNRSYFLCALSKLEGLDLFLAITGIASLLGLLLIIISFWINTSKKNV
ncbi:MAG: hypothetical protein N4A71_06665 [Carboxylicivirga sp.]|jgi:hypothetical protein|nr:hypothetical protein [Carboxylicivirga sp.]